MIRIAEVTALEGHRLWVRFNDRLEGVHVVEPSGRGGVLEPLLEPAFYNAVVINDDSGCVEWPGGADRCPTSMHEELAAAAAQRRHDTEAMMVRETPPAKD